MRVRVVQHKSGDGVFRKRFLVDLRYHGRGARRFFERKADADAYLERYGPRHRNRKKAPADKPTVGAFVDALLAQRDGTCSDATLTIARTQLAHFCAYEARPSVALRDLPLDLLDGAGDLVLDVLKAQAAKGYATDSVRLLRNHIKEVLDRAKSQGYIHDHPLQDPDTLKALRGLFKRLRDAKPDDVKAMDVAQARRFLDAAQDSRLYPLFAVGFGCGPRLGELVGLAPSDDVVRVVQAKRLRQLHVWRKLTQGTSRKDPTLTRLKNGADYFVDVPAHVGAIMDAQPRRSSVWLFATSPRTGRPTATKPSRASFSAC